MKMVRNLVQTNQQKRLFNVINKADITEIYLYDEIGMFGVTSSDFQAALTSVNTNSIDLHLSSPGGDVFDGVAIYNSLKQHPAHVKVSIDGLAASAASFIAQAGDEITIARNASVMIHDAHGATMGNAADHMYMYELLNRQSDNIADVYAQKAGGTAEEWRARMKEETWYIGQEAVDAGLVDSVYSADAVKNEWDLSIFNYRKQPTTPAEASKPERSTVSQNVETGSEETEVTQVDFTLLLNALKEAL